MRGPGTAPSPPLRTTALPGVLPTPASAGSRLHRMSVEVTENVVADGAAHAILSQAKGDLVVMSTHGRTGFDRVLLGSVADKVVRGATGAVLVIPPRAGRTSQDDAYQVAAGIGSR